MSPEAALNLATALAANAVKRQGLTPLAQAQHKIAAGVQPSIDEEMAESGAACKPGCCWCCHRPIPLTILEAAAIVEHIIANWPDERQRELNEKLRTYEIETRFKRADPVTTVENSGRSTSRFAGLLHS
ncbi:MAG TPA: hypothetical protein VGL56_12815 [Fimbriimonadaceae bacterium]|jgi:hypothetical protein